MLIIKKKYDKEMFGTKELQSLEYPNKKTDTSNTSLSLSV
jgi:hypothetical protein